MSRLLIGLIVILLSITIIGCGNKKKGLSPEQWRLTLDSKDKNPYGMWLAYQSLKYFFPKAKNEILPGQFRYTSIDNNMLYNDTGKTLLIVQGLDFYISSEEWTALKEFVEKGNELMIFSSHLDNKIETELQLYKQQCGSEDYLFNQFKVTQQDIKPLTLTADTTKYGYTGRPIRSYFDINIDSTYYYTSSDNYENTEDEQNETDSVVYTVEDGDTVITHYRYKPDTPENADVYYDEDKQQLMHKIKVDTLGFVKNKVNFVRYKLAGGHITLHAAPLTLSNYFLLQPGNENYLRGIWQTLPADISHVYWCDYYKHSNESTDSSVLWRFPSTRYALLLALLAMLTYVLFEGKRRR
jgi:hypothetical protein